MVTTNRANRSVMAIRLVWLGRGFISHNGRRVGIGTRQGQHIVSAPAQQLDDAVNIQGQNGANAVKDAVLQTLLRRPVRPAEQGNDGP